MKEQLEQLLQQSGSRLTKPRLAVFQCLANSDTPLSIADIIRQSPDIERTSIYRTLDLFIQLQAVTTVPHGWKQKYELAEPFRPHHHHFHCDSCHKVISLESPKIEALIKSLMSDQQLTATSHTFEVHGLCNKCNNFSK